jgi:hypothetical protein
MASTINAAVGGVSITSDSSGALNIQVGGVNAIEIGTGASVVISNLALPSSLTLTTLNATSASITTLSGTAATFTNGAFTSANITTATGTAATFTNGAFTSANITTATGTAATFTTMSDGVGNVRNIPSAGAAKTSEYTLTISDIGEFITIGTSGKVLVPNNTFSTGNAISVYNDTTGSVSINISTTTGYVVGTNTNRTGVTLATRGVATVLFINPSYCILSGNLT